MTSFGLHAGPARATLDEARYTWMRAEQLVFDWISVSDHFYAADGDVSAPCLESVVTRAALAAARKRVRCGNLVYSIGYRHPAVLAKAVTAIDHLSDGRAAMGIGSGWAQLEYDAYGIPFHSAPVRTDQLEEGIQVLRSMLHEEVTDFKGKWFTLVDARNEPRPIQAKLPIWIGGMGKRTLRLAAKYSDGWNAPMASVDMFSQKNIALDRNCLDIGRDPLEIMRSVNVGLAWTEESFLAQFGSIPDLLDGGVLTGSDEEVRDTIGRYVEAGADQINVLLRAPFDLDALERFSCVVGMTVTAAAGLA